GLGAGETVTCTFVYVKRGTIQVDVVTAPSGDPQSFGFTLAGGPDAISQSFSLADASAPYASGFVRAGTYAVTAAPVPAAWDLSSSSCSDGSLPAAVGLAPGESVTCTFVYVKRAQIEVRKVVTNEPPPGTTFDPSRFAFDFDASWGAAFVLHHGDSRSSGWITSSRSYQIAEEAVAGWVTSSECVLPGGSIVTGGASISVTPAPGSSIVCTFFNELQLHPGSAGFWRNWRNHYTNSEFLAILQASLAGSPIFATLFDPITGQPRADIITRIDAIFASNGTVAHLLREITSTLLNLGVSQVPAIEGLQRNDDICLECVLDLDELPASAALLRQRAPCDLASTLRIADAVAVAEAAWSGNLSSGVWTFVALSGGELSALDAVFGGINQGNAVIADITRYPAELTCVTAPGPIASNWYRDADADGHGLLDQRTQTCDGVPPAGYAASWPDCDDTAPAVYPGAPEICDGRRNDCFATGWPALAPQETDGDGDGISECAGDCNDADGSTWPGAPELCDGRATNCSAPDWPALPASERDLDGDGALACADCNDANPARHPGAPELCNAVDDDCNGLVDDHGGAIDADGDGMVGACDNCPLLYATNQLDADGDGVGNSCDLCPRDFDPAQLDSDGDGRGNACDSCPLDADSPDHDLDGDRIGDACDNCLLEPNIAQSDSDGDSEGDACDPNDGTIYLRFTAHDALEWDGELGDDSWNCYRGDLAVLRATGVYTQRVGSNALADARGDLLEPKAQDGASFTAGRCAFYLITGVDGGVEGSLGRDGAGHERPNANPLP
ncbi:MAG TPA: MopE-related protein, partial [Candidatus Polarisedimenticolaceae bacterium]|nr:MopE-related protein [Candidatus Polarisedimenticolaceae bacterium]